LPTNLVRAAEEFDIKVVTFGSIMENFPEISESNGYLKSKYMYKDFLVRNAGSTSKTLHLQIHTWYGGIRLHKHMFLGQMFEAISKRKPFEMSSGNQIREYHHISDDVRAIRHLVDLDSTGITSLNHGQSHSLKTIAEYVLSSFGVSELLHVGTLPNPTPENFSTNFARPKSLETIVFRDSLPGIANYFQSLIGRQS
jgi:nucleoside-diphosphate-sugar epimerase